MQNYFSVRNEKISYHSNTDTYKNVYSKENKLKMLYCSTVKLEQNKKEEVYIFKTYTSPWMKFI